MKKTKKRKYKTRKMRMRKRIYLYFLIAIGICSLINFAINQSNNFYSYVHDSFYMPVSAGVNPASVNKRPEIKIYAINKQYYATTTAYNAGDPNQCDSTPCITANGENVCTALALGYKRCAVNNLSFGTRLFVEGYGECIVTDRMNSRYQNGEVDVAFPADQYDEAINFGGHKRLIQILKESN